MTTVITRTGLIASTTLLIAGSVLSAEPTAADQDLAHRAAIIGPAPEELRWQQIPWVTGLSEGQRLAQAERRPIFLWVTGDDPLERC
jgi:hypothetical protein